ncbi:hypothetical protein G7Y89_g3603 [Cudoniella acicularis]|uniref:ATPase, vacuolar ER assembly factor, Vma12 n=1 Tax=Cudoniella acicularis TaxID=354080 RepID=A0A8H4RSD1_9HELO|nr:hypothetical protein G7Y89_g3603 [Cudoniella acicularis]
MVLLTMTASIVEALEKIQSLKPVSTSTIPPTNSSRLERKNNPGAKHGHPIVNQQTLADERRGTEGQEKESSVTFVPSSASSKPENLEKDNRRKDPVLEHPKIGNPISHSQVLDIVQQLKTLALSPSSLEDLLLGVRVYVPPPPPKSEPTSEYKALMARLRRDEEHRSYERMTNPPPPMETFAQRFPTSSAAHAFSSNHSFMNPSDADDGVTYADVDRQMALIFNVLISIVACAAAIWIAARWWSTPARLALSMSGSMFVGVAEVVVYSGYIRRVAEAKGQAKKLKEVKEVVNTWAVGGGEDVAGIPIAKYPIEIATKEDEDAIKARRRKKEAP